VESPCVACCRLNKDKICVGCYRHMDEIADWRKKTPQEYQQIQQLIIQRKQQAILSCETVPMTEAEWKAARQRNAARLQNGGVL
jgi:predicted Fe-S protein YdhL (DUF1289 family)